MLIHPTFDKLQTLRFHGMLKALQEQMQMPNIDQLGFEERLGLLVDREMTERENRRYKTRLSKARLRQQACLEDVDFHQKRGLDKALVMQLSACQDRKSVV
jgi:DNA replication protein DnaC